MTANHAKVVPHAIVARCNATTARNSNIKWISTQNNTQTIDFRQLNRREWFHPFVSSTTISLLTFCTVGTIMGFTTLFVGGGLGFAAQCTSNAIQKIPVSRQPWMHVLCTIGGAWAAQKWVNAKHELLADVNELRAYRGLPPMVGSKTYLPFVPPIEEVAKKE